MKELHSKLRYKLLEFWVVDHDLFHKPQNSFSTLSRLVNNSGVSNRSFLIKGPTGWTCLSPFTTTFTHIRRLFGSHINSHPFHGSLKYQWQAWDSSSEMWTLSLRFSTSGLCSPKSLHYLSQFQGSCLLTNRCHLMAVTSIREKDTAWISPLAVQKSSLLYIVPGFLFADLLIIEVHVSLVLIWF